MIMAIVDAAAPTKSNIFTNRSRRRQLLQKSIITRTKPRLINSSANLRSKVGVSGPLLSPNMNAKMAMIIKIAKGKVNGVSVIVRCRPVTKPTSQTATTAARAMSRKVGVRPISIGRVAKGQQSDDGDDGPEACLNVPQDDSAATGNDNKCGRGNGTAKSQNKTTHNSEEHLPIIQGLLGSESDSGRAGSTAVILDGVAFAGSLWVLPMIVS